MAVLSAEAPEGPDADVECPEDHRGRAVIREAPSGDVMVYETSDGGVRVEGRLDGEAVWLTQPQKGDLFDTSTDNVGLHQKNVLADQEIEESATTEDFSVVQAEGGRQVWHRNGHLVRRGEPLINDVGLAALALLVTESPQKDKDVMIRLVMNMLAEPAP
jgi:hypothetical protein